MLIWVVKAIKKESSNAFLTIIVWPYDWWAYACATHLCASLSLKSDFMCTCFQNLVVVFRKPTKM